MTYSITLRETNEAVTVPMQPEFREQVARSRKARALLGCTASGVLLVDVVKSDGSKIRIDTKALLVRFYHTKDKERTKMFAEAEKLLVAKQPNQAEEILWLAITKPSVIDAGMTNEDGSLKPYVANSKHRGTPFQAHELDTEELQVFDTGAM